MADIPALAILLDNLMETISYNTDLIGRAMSNDLKGLSDDLAVLRASIMKYPDWKKDNELTKKLENEIRDAVFEAENAIETYIVHASKQRHRGFLAKALHATENLSELHSLGKRIADVRAQLEKIQGRNFLSTGLHALQFDEISYMKTKKQIHQFVEDKVIGFEDPAKDVIEFLTGRSRSDELEVISIVGMPGIGKTTLARKVLNDPMIEYEFFTRVFIHVSQDFERKDVFLSILASIGRIDEAANKMSDDELADELRKHLNYKYLIVIDDLWTNDAWDKLKSAFPNNKKGSRVLITTRNAAVAHYTNKKTQPYYLRSLLPEESRELLRDKVFGENYCPEELQRYESVILDKCDGLPLAILVVAGILRNNREDAHWWKGVAENVHDYVAKNDKQGHDVIRRSYNHLPYNLKLCFLYFGVFPEYFEIPVWKLTRLWIAEGFIQHQGLMNLEDVAEYYLQELVDRSLVMIGQKRPDGRIKTCRMNNMLQDFCKKEALEENIFREIKRFDESTSAPYSSSLNTRRLCINSHILEYFRGKPTGDYVRSFLSFPREQIQLPQEHISSIPKAFKLLKVLDIRSIIFTRFPAEFVYLFLLKYIAISCNFKVFPEKLSTLLNLQTIIIDTSSPALEIKADIWKMAQLRHLHTNCSTSIPKGKEDSLINANLQTLSTISPECCKREVFERTPKLRKLGIRGRLGTVIEEIFDSLVKLNFLENLKLLNDDITTRLYSLPQENKFPRKLTRLTLENTSIDWKYMSILGKLENLEVLKLKDNAFLGQFWHTEDRGFRCLRVLHIGRTDLVVWKASASNFPSLRSLFLRYCDRLEAIPSGLGDISSFHVIDLYHTNPSVATSARRIQLLKLRLQAEQEGPKGSAFKLSVYPPE